MPPFFVVQLCTHFGGIPVLKVLRELAKCAHAPQNAHMDVGAWDYTGVAWTHSSGNRTEQCTSALCQCNWSLFQHTSELY